MNRPPKGTWRRKSAKVLLARGERVAWRVECGLLDTTVKSILTDAQTWTLIEKNGQ